MKNKKIIFTIVAILLIILVGVAVYIVINKKDTKPNTTTANTLVEALLNKDSSRKYLKFVGGEVLNEDTSFINFAFISDNVAYIYNPDKLEKEELSYKKAYDIPKDVKVMNIRPSLGADITFLNYSDEEYVIEDENLDNTLVLEYKMFENAKYKIKNLSSLINQKYSESTIGKKVDYDFMSTYVYSKDNVLYTHESKEYDIRTRIYTPGKIEKIDGNYEGEKVIRIYNERILKTDKGFYEIIRYFDTNSNKLITTTMKINLLTKYYDEVLTFTYKYVILKDYTLIPIRDVMPDRPQEYQYNYYCSKFNEIPTMFEE